jgi:YVTN family beta-propeller protein
MDHSATRSPARAKRLRRVSATVTTIVLALSFALATSPIANAATLTNAWQAKIGTGGANGTATINAYTTGAGSIVLKLAKLKVSTSHTILVSKGNCSRIGTTLIKVASIKTSSKGTATRTTSLTAAQVTAIKAATRGTGKLAIRVAYGSSIKCGAFAPVGVPPYVSSKIAVGRSPAGVAIDPSGVWVANWWDNSLSRISPTTNTVLGVLPIDFSNTQGAQAIGSGEGSLWVTATDSDANSNSLPGVVKRVDPASGVTLATIAVGKEPYDIDVSAGAVWVANYDDNSVMRIDPATNQVVATVPIPYANGVTVGLGAVWVVSTNGMVTRIDPATNQILATIPTQATGAFIATGNGAVWVTNPGTEGQADGSLSRIDPATNQVVARTAVGSNPQELAVSGTNVWIGMFGEATVVRVSATTNAVLNRVAVSANVYAITVTSGVVWAVHNLPTPEGSSEPPVGSVTRINASFP